MIAVLDKAADLLVAHAAVQNNADPVELVHVVGRHHSLKAAAPEVAPGGLRLHVHPHAALMVVNGREHLLVAPVAHDGPVPVVKGIVLVNPRQLHAQAYGLFPCGHILPPTIVFFDYITREKA